MRQMTLVGFLQAQNCTQLASSWRHPESRNDSMSKDFYRRIAQVLEAGKFDLGFFDDRLAMPDMRSEEHTSELQSLMRISYAVFCLKKKKKTQSQNSI